MWLVFYDYIIKKAWFLLHRNILCFPIKNEAGNVLGVAQLCNKKTGPYFTTFDEDVASAFAVYCCISISHVSLYSSHSDIHLSSETFSVNTDP